MAKKEFMGQNAENALLKQRYHAEGEEGAGQRFTRFKPGQISDELKEAMGLDKHQTPHYIYQMRLLGYPPGYLKHAEVMRSGLTVYDIKDGDEPGQIKTDETDGRPTYDPSKLIEYPGFNVPLPDGIRDPHNVPPMQPSHSKDAFQLFMTPPNNGRKRGRRDFAEDPDKKRLRAEREEVDMDLDGNTPDCTAKFKPPLPPTPIPETPPPLPTSTPPATPGNTPRMMQSESSREFRDVGSPGGASTDTDVTSQDTDVTSQSSGTARSMSPSIDDLQMMQSRLREALMQAAEEGGGSVPSDADNASERFMLDGEEFIVDSVSDDEGEETTTGAVKMDSEDPEPTESLEEDGREPQTSGCLPIAAKEACEAQIPEDDGQSGELIGETSTVTPDQNMINVEATAAEQEKPEAGEDRDNLEPGEIYDSDLDATPNRSGVPHISKFAVGISPHENDNLSESTGMLKRIMSIFKRKKGKPSS